MWLELLFRSRRPPTNREVARSVAIFAAVLSIAWFSEHWHKSVERARLPQIEPEFTAIQPLENPTSCYKGGKFGGGVSIGCNYSTNRPYSDIKDHFDPEFTQRGWRRTGESHYLVWWRDDGGRTLHYRKGQLVATVSFGGEMYRGVYAVQVKWPDY